MAMATSTKSPSSNFLYQVLTLPTKNTKLLTLGELLVTVKRNMKGPIITHFYGVFLCLLCALPFILIALFPLFIKKLGSYTFIMFSVLALVLFLLALLLLLFLSIVWALSMAVSVVETGCYGPRAFKRAAKLAKEKKMRGFLIILVSAQLVGALYAIYKMSLMYSSSSTVSVLVLGFFYTVFGELVSMYLLVAFVIYYYECKMSHGEGDEEEDEVKSGGFVYKRLPSKAIRVDEELP